MYDITRRESFIHLGRWLAEAQQFASPDIVITLVGNKADLEHRRAVEKSEGEAFAKENGLLFMEVHIMIFTNAIRLDVVYIIILLSWQTSAKSADCVDEAFLRTAELVFQKTHNSGDVSAPFALSTIGLMVYVCVVSYVGNGGDKAERDVQREPGKQ